MHSTVKTIRALYKRIKRDEVMAMGGQLSYHLLLAFFPFLIFLVTLLGYTPLTGEQMLSDLQLVIPQDAHRLISAAVKEIAARRSGTLLSFGMLSSLWIASNGVTAVLKGINKAYGCAESRPFWKLKAIVLLYTAGLALLLLFFFTLLVFWPLLGKHVFGFLGLSVSFVRVWDYARFAIAAAASLLIFATLYYILPDKRLRFKDILPGTALASALWMLISVSFSFYVNNYKNYSGLYGSIGGIIALLLWLYWTSITVLIGGELNAVVFERKEEK